MKILIFCLTLFFPLVLNADTIKTFGRGCHTDIPFNKMFCETLKQKEKELLKPINIRINGLNDSLGGIVGDPSIDGEKISVRGRLKSDEIGSSFQWRWNKRYMFVFNIFYMKNGLN